MLPLFQLNPRYPRVWQSPTTLQIGINPPKVILDNVPDQALALLHALESAIPRTAAQVIASHTAWWIQDLLTRSHQGEVITLNALTREVTYTQVEPSERCSCVRLDS